MTTTSTPPTTSTRATSQRRQHLAGTAALVRFMLRRDRVRLPAWAAGFGLFIVYLHAALPNVAETEEELAGTAELFGDPVGRMLIGPGYGFDDPTFASFIANGYGLYFLILAGLMSILLISRHTRVEEQSGRAELVRANVVGRHAPLTAALLVALITNLVVALVVAGAMAGVGGYEAAASLLFGVGIGLTGLAFAGVATITVQLSEYSRAASGMAGGVLGAAFVIRAGGDMAELGGNALSWFSPLAWAQQTAPFVLDRWWPLALALGMAAAATVIGFVLSTRRDFGASRLAVRPGPAQSRPSLGTPVGLALRLQRASIIGWGASLTVAGLLFGAYADAMISAIDDMPEVFLELFGAEDMLAGYLGYMAVYMSYFVGAFAIMAVQGLRTEETSGRLEPVLATPTSRVTWLASNLAVTAVASVVMLLAIGAGTGVGAAIVTGDAAHVWELTLAHVNHAPAALVVLGVAALFLGVLPRAIPATWVLVGYGLFVGTFGPMMDLPQTAYDLSPFSHLAEMPLEDFKFAPVPILVLIAVGAAGIGMLALRRRDLDTT